MKGLLKGLPLALLTLAAAACSSGALQVPQSPLLAALERKSGRIVYVGIDGNIHTVDQSGGDERAITEDAIIDPEGDEIRYYDFPTWSGQEERIAFVGYHVTRSGESSSSLYTIAEDDEAPDVLYSSEMHVPIYLYWSPDGQWVSFLTQAIDGGVLSMRIVDVEGEETSVIDTGQPYYWAWSPVSHEVLSHVGGSGLTNPGEARLSILELGPNVREIGLRLNPTNFQAPAFSPDGAWTLFASEGRGGSQELALGNAAGILESYIFSFDGFIAFDWAPKGDYVAYITIDPENQSRVGTLHFLNMKKPSEPEVITSGAESVAAFFWAPDGKQLAYFVPVLVPIDGDPENLSEENMLFFLELHIAQARTGETDLVARFQPGQAFMALLPFFDQYQRSVTIWSPDSNYLVITAADGLFIVPASGDFEPRFLVPGRLGFWSRQ